MQICYYFEASQDLQTKWYTGDFQLETAHAQLFRRSFFLTSLQYQVKVWFEHCFKNTSKDDNRASRAAFVSVENEKLDVEKLQYTKWAEKHN